ncbi:hypothetical protein ACNFJN_04430 [Xenorhabdus budapestensis]|uniref:Uncharacterized protein n=1 Tax=Xenorhabdus budapestensis TaxID=290110 RepID=A0ABX7VLH8_XENBU|nr:hypothetical protein [Xenorhabdus budapestensis]QTL40557.1 hypothetical protein HGO23_03975 [Xenorhabdus budapestensis]
MITNSDIIYDDDDEYITSDRYFRYEDDNGKTRSFKVYSVKYEGRPMIHKDAFYERYTKRGNVRFITCLCGSNDWNENGRFINEYECNGCGGFIEVIADDE